MSRPAIVAPASRGAEQNASARLELLESLIASGEVSECAQLAVDWLSQHAGARSAICALLDTETGQLRGTAGAGVTAAQLSRLAVDKDAEAHPLAFALLRDGPIVFQNGRSRGAAAPFGPGPFVAVPLPIGERPEGRVGILLVAPPAKGLDREARWVADLLGQRLLQLKSQERLANAERRLLRERELLGNLINAVPDPVLLTDTEGRIIISNSRADALFATREDQSEGRQRAVSLNNMLFSAALSRQAIDDPAAARRELLLVNPTEGTDLLFELLSATVQDPREGTRIVSILRNVTDLRAATEQIEENYRKLKLAEADVRAERDRLDLVIDSVADPILVTDPAGKILLMNTPAERLFTAQEGSEDVERAVRTNDAHFSSFVSNLFFTGDGLRWRGEIALLDPSSGLPLPVEAISGKVMSEHGEVTAVVTILHDRTEALEKGRLYEQLKQASEKLEDKVREATGELVRRNELLQRQAIELEQASQLKSQFLANMSHEFRTPLNAILGYTSMLLGGVNGELTPPQKKNLGRVDSNAKHLLSIINDLLDISRIEAGKMPLHLEEFALQQLVGEVLAEVEPLISRARLSASTEITGELPAISSDRQKLKQIVLNLLTNAIKFTPHGSVKVTCRYEAGRQEFAISVTDTGIGIAPQDLNKIFEDFRQADDSVTRQYGGAGLGLAICRRLAVILGGRIDVQSQLGRGSTFTFYVPRFGRQE